MQILKSFFPASVGLSTEAERGIWGSVHAWSLAAEVQADIRVWGLSQPLQKTLRGMKRNRPQSPCLPGAGLLKFKHADPHILVSPELSAGAWRGRLPRSMLAWISDTEIQAGINQQGAISPVLRQRGNPEAGSSLSLQCSLPASPLIFWGGWQRRLQMSIIWSQNIGNKCKQTAKAPIMLMWLQVWGWW